jgi:hypothetical protein
MRRAQRTHFNSTRFSRRLTLEARTVTSSQQEDLVMTKEKKEAVPLSSGYLEKQPMPAKKHQKYPDAKTPHEHHNVPTRKPKGDSG